MFAIARKMALAGPLALVFMTAAATGFDIPVSGFVVNPCNGELVAFNGTEHIVDRLTFGPSGSFHEGFHVNIHVTGEGDQGNSYVGNQEENFQFNGRIGIEETDAFSFSEISKGSAPNFEVHALLHVTVNANGTVTTFVDNFTATCRG